MNTAHHDVYRRFFWIATFAAIAFAILSGVLWWHSRYKVSPNTRSVPTAESASQAPMSSGEPLSDPQDLPLAPIQLSSQQMQNIGIVLGRVQMKSVSTDLRFYGNVQVDERREAYVQTRFAGWIRKVYADATGNFVSKGQRLFSIYSPDLVATEQEYLLAEENSKALQQSPVNGVALGASSLLSAAKDRLLQWNVS